MSVFKRGEIFHYDFWFQNRRYVGTTRQLVRRDAILCEQDVKRRVRRQSAGLEAPPVGEAHPPAAIRAFMAHYQEERPHQGLANERIAPTTASTGPGPIQCRERLGGGLKFYYHEAASLHGPSFRTRGRAIP